MVMRFPGSFADARGREGISIVADGRTLRLTIRGVEFTGLDFDDLEPAPVALAPRSLTSPAVRSPATRWTGRCPCKWPLPVVTARPPFTATWSSTILLPRT